MTNNRWRSKGIEILQKWWTSLLFLPFIMYSIHQCYRVLRYNVFFSISYDFPFPVSWVHFLLDNFLLIVHEAGHTFFSIFGSRNITILGGSLFEILLPIMVFAFTWINQLKKGMPFALYLVGFSFMSVAFYAADGSARQLPLIGGLGKESHDWYNLLSQWNLLDQDDTIAMLIAFMGCFCYFWALLIPAFFKKYEQVNIDLKI